MEVCILQLSHSSVISRSQVTIKVCTCSLSVKILPQNSKTVLCLKLLFHSCSFHQPSNIVSYQSHVLDIYAMKSPTYFHPSEECTGKKTQWVVNIGKTFILLFKASQNDDVDQKMNRHHQPYFTFSHPMLTPVAESLRWDCNQQLYKCSVFRHQIPQ